MLEKTITLRDAARRLSLVKNRKATTFHASELLGLLKSRELTAGFYVQDGHWIEIPLDYWLARASSELRILHIKGRSSGAYRVRGNQFPDKIATLIFRQKQNISNIASLIAAGDRRSEVCIKERDFLAYLEKHGLQEPQPVKVVGRDQLNWKDLSSYIAAYVAAYQRDFPHDGIKSMGAAARIYELARVDVGDLPQADTIAGVVSKAKKLLKKPEFRLRK